MDYFRRMQYIIYASENKNERTEKNNPSSLSFMNDTKKNNVKEIDKTKNCKTMKVKNCMRIEGTTSKNNYQGKWNG